MISVEQRAGSWLEFWSTIGGSGQFVDSKFGSQMKDVTLLGKRKEGYEIALKWKD